MTTASEPLYHVTSLSNFARGFDKYTRRYRKGGIPESRYPNESYLLTAPDLAVGVAKASKLRDKLRIPGDELLVLQTSVSRASVVPNPRTGIGLLWPSPDLPIAGVFRVDPLGKLGSALGLEEAMARSLELHASSFAAYADLRPRSLSFLPIARGCQAACPFCFSEASVSTDQEQGRFEMKGARAWIDLARRRGAERAVITGGGEPTLLPHARLLELVNACNKDFDKVVLITNGVRFASAPAAAAATQLGELCEAGLSVLAVSRHHHEEAINAKLMNLETETPALMQLCAANRDRLSGMRLRLICVLQRGGVESVGDIQNYVGWAASLGVDDVCFKELYVSTSEESVYHSRSTNAWSAKNQVSLSIVADWAGHCGFEVVDRLPWGAPIFRGVTGGRCIRVAAYTEPSLFWERSTGIARSWNVMSDGACLASLEDRRSKLELCSAACDH
ncbi:MAG TPA: radical SAM protein [Gammaproteobacteria bacterium]|nr:radical SAM protein [Gammaproteobacteria bacterium]